MGAVIEDTHPKQPAAISDSDLKRLGIDPSSALLVGRTTNEVFDPMSGGLVVEEVMQTYQTQSDELTSVEAKRSDGTVSIYDPTPIRTEQAMCGRSRSPR